MTPEGCHCGEECACGCHGVSGHPWCPCGCGYTSNEMFAYLDRLLGAWEGAPPDTDEHERAFLEHVRNCPHCAARLRRERLVRTRTRTCCQVQTPHALYVRIREQIRVISEGPTP